jgi:hypothetical protein
MRGVEGAGAYRIGHPLGVENDSPPFRFQIFLRNMAGALQPAKYLMTFTNVAPVRLFAVATESKNVAGGPKNLISGRRGASPKRPGKRAHEKQDKKHQKQHLCDRRRQSCQCEKSQKPCHQGQEQKGEGPTKHVLYSR